MEQTFEGRTAVVTGGMMFIRLQKVLSAGLLGVALGLVVLIVGGTGLAGLAAANPAYLPTAGPATVLIAASVVVTAIGCPLMVAWYAKRLKAEEAAAASPEVPAAV